MLDFPVYVLISDVVHLGSFQTLHIPKVLLQTYMRLFLSSFLRTVNRVFDLGLRMKQSGTSNLGFWHSTHVITNPTYFFRLSHVEISPHFQGSKVNIFLQGRHLPCNEEFRQSHLEFGIKYLLNSSHEQVYDNISARTSHFLTWNLYVREVTCFS